MSDDLTKAIAAAQEPLLEQLASIEKIMRTMAAAQVAPLLYDPKTLGDKVAEHIKAAEAWRNAVDDHNELLNAPGDVLGLGDNVAAKADARRLRLRSVQETNKALKELTEREPVIAALVRANGGKFP